MGTSTQALPLVAIDFLSTPLIASTVNGMKDTHWRTFANEKKWQKKQDPQDRQQTRNQPQVLINTVLNNTIQMSEFDALKMTVECKIFIR